MTRPDNSSLGWGRPLALLVLGPTVGETVADQQLWRFQLWQKHQLAASCAVSPPFPTTGLFRYSRHPNYFLDIAQWWLFSLLGEGAHRSVLTNSVVGTWLWTLFLVGSPRFTESVTVDRYPAFRAYQSSMSAIIPWWQRRTRATTNAAPFVVQFAKRNESFCASFQAAKATLSDTLGSQDVQKVHQS